MGRRDTFQNSVGFNYPLYFYKRNEDYNDSAVLEYSKEKIGPLYCKLYVAMSKSKEIIDMQFQFDRDSTTIKTMDIASDMHAGDKVLFMGKEWLVDGVQSKPYQNNSEFDNKPSMAYYISIKGV